MTLRRPRFFFLFAPALAALVACSSDDDTGLTTPSPAGGSAGTAGKGGKAGTGGATSTEGGTGGTDGEAGEGGSGGKGGASGKGGAAGKGGAGGKGGGAGKGGSVAGEGGSDAGEGGSSAGEGGSSSAGEGGSGAGEGGSSSAGEGGSAGQAGGGGAAGGAVDRQGDLPPGLRGPGGVPDTCGETNGKIGCCDGQILYGDQRGETCATRCAFSLELGRYSCHVGASDPDEDPSGSFPRACGGPPPVGACACTDDSACGGKPCDILTGNCFSFGSGCNGDGDCDSFAPHCATDNHRCEECVDDTHCTTSLDGQRCRSSRNCGCYQDSDCPSAKPRCGEGHQCEQCKVNADCKDPKRPVCSILGECGACAEDWDCKDPAKPVCVLSECAAGDTCKDAGEDASEPNDDGPAGARILGIDKPVAGFMCDEIFEGDWYVLDQTFDSDSFVFRLESPAITTMLLEVYDATFARIGSEGRGSTRFVTASYLPKGKYYVKVGGYLDKSTTYTLTAERSPSGDCDTDADCRAGYATQVFRGSCNKTLGACLPIVGKGARALGATCDSDDDCATGVCGAAPYTKPAPGRAVCTNACLTQADCEAQPGTVCDYVDYNARGCVAPCQSASDCAPYASGVFADEHARYVCNLTKGYCEEP